jgi:hypothetical protein
MLHILTSGRDELILRCRAKMVARLAPEHPEHLAERGLHLFIDQLVDTLRREQLTNVRPIGRADPTPADSPIGRSAALHGVELLHLGYTVDEVVHYYGNVCQAVAELAVEQRTTISADQFRTLNRCLDEAIADAVSAYSADRENAIAAQSANLHKSIGAVAERERALLTVAIQTFAAIKGGNIGVSGATGTALVNILYELRDEVDKSLPEIRLASGMTGMPPAPEQDRRRARK